MKVVFTADVRRVANAVDTWWREHRDHVDVFERELAAAVEQIGAMPDALAVYAATRGGLVRRPLLPKTNHHVYFVHDTGIAPVGQCGSAALESMTLMANMWK